MVSGKQTTYKCDAAQLRRVMALLQWMEHCNNDASIRRPSFRRTDDPAFSHPSEAPFWDISNTEGQSLTDKYPNNAPGLDAFLECMYFIQAVNDGSLELTGDAKGIRISDFARYINQPEAAQVTAVSGDTPTHKKAQQQLANEMLNQLTRFNVYERYAEKRSEFNPGSDDEKAYNMLARLHAVALDRRGSGTEFGGEGQSAASKGARRLVKSGMVFVLFPVFILIGGAVSVGNLLGYRARGTTVSGSYRSYLYGLFSSMSFSMGESGANYLAEAGIDFPFKEKRTLSEIFDQNSENFPWYVKGAAAVLGYGLHEVVATVSVVAATVPELIVKSFLFPLKWALEYDQWAPDGYARKAMDALESTLIGVLSSPIILLNHLYASIEDVVVKTFAPFEEDPGLIDAQQFLEKYMDIKLNLKDPDFFDYLFILPYKALRIVLDTLPRILSRTLVNTVRSIFPALPGTTQAQRDKFFDVLERTAYSTFFMINALFFAALLTVVSGGTIPVGLSALFGSAEAIESAGGLVSSYGGQIASAFQHAVSGIGSFASNPVAFFKETLNLGNFTSMFEAGGVFGKDGALYNAFAGIKNWKGTTWAIIGTVGPVALMGIALGAKKYKAYQAEKKTSTNLEEALVPGIKAKGETIQAKRFEMRDVQHASVSVQPRKKPDSIDVLFERSKSSGGASSQTNSKTKPGSGGACRSD